MINFKLFSNTYNELKQWIDYIEIGRVGLIERFGVSRVQRLHYTKHRGTILGFIVEPVEKRFLWVDHQEYEGPAHIHHGSIHSFCEERLRGTIHVDLIIINQDENDRSRRYIDRYTPFEDIPDLNGKLLTIRYEIYHG